MIDSLFVQSHFECTMIHYNSTEGIHNNCFGNRDCHNSLKSIQFLPGGLGKALMLRQCLLYDSSTISQGVQIGRVGGEGDGCGGEL